jgi:hypothetical protein
MGDSYDATSEPGLGITGGRLPQRSTVLHTQQGGNGVVDEVATLLEGTRDLRHSVSDSFAAFGPDEAGSLVASADDWHVSASSRSDAGVRFVLEDAHAVVHLSVHQGRASVRSVADSPESADRMMAAVRELIEAPAPDDEQARVSFWSSSSNARPNALTRDVPAPMWLEIQANYGADVRTEMESLLELDDCPDARLILWHGPPGTGKTHALRALARAWSGWCSSHYVTDPQRFLWDVSDYLLRVVTFPEKLLPDGATRTKLLILEDAGELMSTTARSDAGEELSRLLNLTDGLLGQGLELLVLITTNEPIGRLHPAVTRPGRCLAEVEFGELTAAEANGWLMARGSGQRVSTAATLAELYALERGDAAHVSRRHPIGFAA